LQVVGVDGDAFAVMPVAFTGVIYRTCEDLWVRWPS